MGLFIVQSFLSCKTTNCTCPTGSCNFVSLWKIYLCLFIPNCTWNHLITYTKHTLTKGILHEATFIELYEFICSWARFFVFFVSTFNLLHHLKVYYTKLFKMTKSDVYFIVITFWVAELFKILIYANNRTSDKVDTEWCKIAKYGISL